MFEGIDDWAKTKNKLILVLQNGIVYPWTVKQWIYSVQKLKTLCQQVGFANVMAYDWLDGSPYNHQAKRLVVVAIKQ